MRISRIVSIAAGALVAASALSANAQSVNLQDDIFEVQATNPGGSILSFTEDADGTLFTFTATERLTTTNISPPFVAIGALGLPLGGASNPAGALVELELEVSENVRLNSYAANTNIPPGAVVTFGTIAFDILDDAGTILSEDNFATGFSGTRDFAGAPIDLLAGLTYVLDVDESVFTPGGAGFHQGFLAGFNFEAAPVAPIPIPAALPLLLSGLLGLGLTARRRRARTS